MRPKPQRQVVDAPGGNEENAVRSRLRTCVGCGARREQREMLRVAAASGARPVLDTMFRAPGRGAYLCRQVDCVEKACKRRALERSLKLKNNVPASLRDDIMKVLSTML